MENRKNLFKMKKIFEVLIWLCVGYIVCYIARPENSKPFIKGLTLQYDTVKTSILTDVDINVDTVRTYYKDNLIIVKGRKGIKENFNVEKSEWIDDILLTKPKSVIKKGYGGIIIRYEELVIEKYVDGGHTYLSSYLPYTRKTMILYDPDNHSKENRVSKETVKNIETIIKRYQKIKL